jgi:protoporphyrinogen oxidase
MENSSQTVVVLGAGPAGLACAERLVSNGVQVVVLDKNEKVGGLARTEEFQGHLFDVGPHRFFTKNEEVESFWKQYAGDDLITVTRLTRILYRNKLLQYPLQPFDALRGLGLWNSCRAVVSYAWAKVRWRKKEPKNFEDWVVSRFGRVLYDAFFKTYTEKIWGIPCNEIGVEWAEQRIKGLSFLEVVRNALGLGSKNKVKSLVDEFMYTKRGAGLVYENIAQKVRDAGSRVVLEARVVEIEHLDGKVTAVTYETKAGERHAIAASHLFTSIPLTEFVLRLNPPSSPACITAARKLYYRDHITVNLILPRSQIFPDQWIYIHSPEVRMARVSEYGNFSRSMVSETTCAVSVEYFCFAHEPLWQSTDDELTKLALRELRSVDLISSEECLGAYVVREPDSYPAYYLGHKPHFNVLKEFVASLSNVDAIGRGGMYKYNNQDHSILSGICAARRFFGEEVDVWEVNTDQAYLEEKQLPSPLGAGPSGER